MELRKIVLLLAALILAATSVIAQPGKPAADDAEKHPITAKELKERTGKGEKIIIIDARHYLNGQIIQGAVHVPMDKLESWAKDVDKKAVIVTYCTCPHDEAADAEVKQLRGWGYAQSFSLSGGLEAARAAGFVIAAPEQQ